MAQVMTWWPKVVVGLVLMQTTSRAHYPRPIGVKNPVAVWWERISLFRVEAANEGKYR